MSGSGGGSSYGGGGMSDFDCNNVYISTTVVSPDQVVLQTVKAGDILQVSLQSATGPVVVIANIGNVLGSIFHMDLAALIQCITDGNAYKALIQSITGGKVQVLITRV
jgi:hypothetical protein